MMIRNVWSRQTVSLHLSSTCWRINSLEIWSKRNRGMISHFLSACTGTYACKRACTRTHTHKHAHPTPCYYIHTFTPHLLTKGTRARVRTHTRNLYYYIQAFSPHLLTMGSQWYNTLQYTVCYFFHTWGVSKQIIFYHNHIVLIWSCDIWAAVWSKIGRTKLVCVVTLVNLLLFVE